MTFLVFVASLLGSFRVGMIVHELSHAGAAWLLRIPVRAIQFGHGRVWWEKRLGGVTWRICGALSGGQVEARMAEGAHARLRDTLMTAAGPAVDLAMAVSCTLASNRAFADFLARGTDDLWVRATAGATFGLWWSFIHSVSRRTTEIGGRTQLTDVGIIWELWREPEAHYVHRQVTVRAFEELERREASGDAMHMRDWERLAGEPLLRELDDATIALIEAYPPGDERRLHAIDEVCTRALFSGDREAWERCLPWSAELQTSRPEEWTYAGTRGSLLLVNGHVAEGVALLERVHARTASAWDRAIAACCLAWAAHRRGDGEARDRWWQESLRQNEGDVVMPWVAREIAVPSLG